MIFGWNGLVEQQDFDGNQKTKILKIDENKTFSWPVVEPYLKLTRGKTINGHSLVTIKSSYINEAYVLLIGRWKSRSHRSLNEVSCELSKQSPYETTIPLIKRVGNKTTKIHVSN